MGSKMSNGDSGSRATSGLRRNRKRPRRPRVTHCKAPPVDIEVWNKEVLHPETLNPSKPENPGPRTQPALGYLEYRELAEAGACQKHASNMNPHNKP